MTKKEELYKKLSQHFSPDVLTLIQELLDNSSIEQTTQDYSLENEVRLPEKWVDGSDVYRKVILVNDFVLPGNPMASVVIDHQLHVKYYLRLDLLINSNNDDKNSLVNLSSLSEDNGNFIQKSAGSFLLTSPDSIVLEECGLTTNDSNVFVVLEYVKYD